MQFYRVWNAHAREREEEKMKMKEFTMVIGVPCGGSPLEFCISCSGLHYIVEVKGGCGSRVLLVDDALSLDEAKRKAAENLLLASETIRYFDPVEWMKRVA